MLTLITTLRAHAAKRALYRETRDALANMAPTVARDLGLSPSDADRIAHRAVWG
jgi:uncharacterized protein YjiS (DUF1127 family)